MRNVKATNTGKEGGKAKDNLAWVKWKTRSAECEVWKTRSVENEECRKCGVWKMRSVENAEC